MKISAILLTSLLLAACKSATTSVNDGPAATGHIAIISDNVTDTTDPFWRDRSGNLNGTYAIYDSAKGSLIVKGADGARHISVELSFTRNFGAAGMTGSYMTGGIDPPDVERVASLLYRLHDNVASDTVFMVMPRLIGSAEITTFDNVHGVVSGTFDSPVANQTTGDTTRHETTGWFRDVPIVK